MSTQIDNSPAEAPSKLNIYDEDHELIESLMKLSKDSPKLVRSTEYSAPADPSIIIRSWKMNEFKYYNIPSPFPTLARGLFTRDVDVNGEAKHVIVARGYDKFFNIGEVPWTTWASLEAYTKPPYTLTLKANGCIIFVAALTPTKVVVTSKHSLGPINGNDESHAMVGERWLRRHLAAVGKTEEQLAKRLWEKKWTAVAELCDDSFEEHVLRTTKENTGLHLHGINECSGEFKTMHPDIVDTFAREFGFIVTPSMQLKTIPEVREYTEQVGETGIWRGEALEGFVVRTHVYEPPGKGLSASPYAPGSSFFFKVKFDEPYMIYRDWREVTKTLLSKGPDVSNLPKSKMHRPETQAYAKWIIDEIKRDRGQFDQYAKGKGIIATRERFLEWFRSEQGKAEFTQGERECAEKQAGTQAGTQKTFGKTIIIPVAIPGCGKTTISVALTHLFGFGHTQSDDVKVKKSAPVFIRNVVDLLKTHDVVIADKNNHLKQHRAQLREAARKFDPPARLVALNWTLDLPFATIHRICGDRVFERGDKHQTLHADVIDRLHEDVIWQFLHNAHGLSEDEVDVSVDMNVEEPIEDALARAVDACVRILGVKRPSVERMGEALALARGYHTTVTQNKTEKEKKAKDSTPRYYAFLPEIDVEDLLERRFAAGDVPQEGVDFLAQLKRDNRLPNRSHITIVHEKSLPEQQPLWDRCNAIFALPSPPTFTFKLGSVVWNDRVMTLSVSDLSVSSDEEDVDGAGTDFVAKLPEEVRVRLHITVGTANGDIAPVEARDLVSRWKYGEKIASCELEDVQVKGRVKGFRG